MYDMYELTGKPLREQDLNLSLQQIREAVTILNAAIQNSAIPNANIPNIVTFVKQVSHRMTVVFQTFP